MRLSAAYIEYGSAYRRCGVETVYSGGSGMWSREEPVFHC